MASCAVVPEATTYEQTVREFLFYEQNGLYSTKDYIRFELGDDNDYLKEGEEIDEGSTMVSLYYR